MQSVFEPAYPLADLVPASYNPRLITPDALDVLQASLRDLGLIKPVIVTTERTIVAGHQRTKAMTALGYTHCPAFVLPPVGTTDEVRFNQLHNASDLDSLEVPVFLPPGLSPGFHRVSPEDITAATLRSRNAPKRTEILRLLTKYGEWGSCVAMLDTGEVLVSGLYALCCKVLGRSCLVYVLPPEKKPLAEFYFGRAYGRFDYSHLPRTTYAQSLAQMMRLRERKTGQLRKDGTPKGKSRTYEHLLLPRLRDLAGYGLPENPRVLDFGAGQMDYVKFLRKSGVDGKQAVDIRKQAVDIIGVEFYFRRGLHLDTNAAQADITALCYDLSTKGRFDIVICDSVLNSVDSVQAEADVLTCLSALCKPGGLVIFSGRSRDAVERKETQQTTNTDPDTRYVHFFDENGLTAMFSNGVWRYQKFHTLPEIERLTRTHFGDRFRIVDSDNQPAKSPLRASGWGVVTLNDRHRPASDYLPSLRREFDLPLPHGKRFGRSDDIEAAFLAALRVK